jgi:TonB family protein
MGEGFESIPFRSLEFRRTPWSRWASGFAINAGVIAVLIAIPVTVHNVVEPRDRLVVASLTAPVPPAPSKVKTKPIQKVVPIPPPEIVIKPTPRIPFKAPPVKFVEKKTIALPAAPVEIPKAQEVIRVETPKVELPARPVIKESVFPPSVAARPVNSPAPGKIVETGGFGDPNGAQPSAASTKKSALQSVGLFDAPAGKGSATASGGRAKAVASAGFGTAVEGPATTANHAAVRGAGFGAPVESAAAPSGQPPVRGSGFGEYAAPARETPAARASAPAETPVEITYKPKPVYTPEAREKKIEGEVQLEVLFSSSGEVRVLRVIRGLGFGLDESARAAAGQIRFHPGTRNGSPVDMTGTVHIVFELS